MFGWLRRNASDPPQTDDADAALARAHRTLREVETNIAQRAPLLRETRELSRRNGVAEDIAKAFRVRGAA